jgi:hypothetical protein
MPTAAPPPPPHSWRPGRAPRRGGIVGKLVLLGLLVALIILPFTGIGRKLKDRTLEVIKAAQSTRVVVETRKETEVVEREKIVYRDPPPPPLPSKFVPAKTVAVSELFNGIKIETELETSEGGLASKERKQPESYEAKFSLKIRVPKANTTLEELAGINPELPKGLPGLPVMLPLAKVSGFYHHLYELKQKSVQQALTRLDKALTRHNFFDCETMLELEFPPSGQKALFIQGEMDVVADGSDGDRLTDFDDYIFKSDHFQATTSYSWKKQTAQPNPLIARYESRIADLKRKLEGASAAQKKDWQGDIDYYKRVIASLKTTSFLIAQEDPFIVIPLSVRPYAGVNGFTPQIGDYAVVMHGKKLLPAIVGDFGPAHLMGEASLRIAKELNGRATPFTRPESDLRVSYFIFPGSADKPFGPPDYEKWHRRCGELLVGVGGVGEGFELLKWEDRIKKKKEEEEAAKAKAAAEAAAKAEAEAAAKAAAEAAAKATPP